MRENIYKKLKWQYINTKMFHQDSNMKLKGKKVKTFAHV